MVGCGLGWKGGRTFLKAPSGVKLMLDTMKETREVGGSADEEQAARASGGAAGKAERWSLIFGQSVTRATVESLFLKVKFGSQNDERVEPMQMDAYIFPVHPLFQMRHCL